MAGRGAGWPVLCPHRPALPRPAPPTPQQSLLTMEEIQSVEETQIKERKCLLLKIRGGKQFVLQCDVSGARGQSVGADWDQSLRVPWGALRPDTQPPAPGCPAERPRAGAVEEGAARCLPRGPAARAARAQDEEQATLTRRGAEQGAARPAWQCQWPLTRPPAFYKPLIYFVEFLLFVFPQSGKGFIL